MTNCLSSEFFHGPEKVHQVRTLGVVSVARSDYGIYHPLLRKIVVDRELKLQLYVAGSHLAQEFGLTVGEIERDGFPIFRRLETLLGADSPEAIAKSIGVGVSRFAEAFATERPDLLVVLGDRFDMYPACVAAVPYKLPVAHIHGGELTFGAIDDALRHSMTKLSHLHFASTDEYARRIRQMGEEPWRITVSGALSLDNLASFTPLSTAEIEKRWSLQLGSPFLLATYHPVTLEPEHTVFQVREFLTALDTVGLPTVITFPNADTNGRAVIQILKDFAGTHPQIQLVQNLGIHGYFSLMKLASAMVGNSSSGILEAASFKLPVVNIGSRQEGRSRGKNVIDCGYSSENIGAAIRKALSNEFRQGLRELQNPYQGPQPAADLILERLKSVSLDEKLIQKRFVDLPAA